jgi:glutathione S-transferase
MLSMDFARRLPRPALSDVVKDQIAEIMGYWRSALDRHGRDRFLFGDFSVADCMYAPVVSRFRTYGIELPAELRSYSARMFELPGMRKWGDASRAEVESGLAQPR